MLCAFVACASALHSMAATETVDGIDWTYYISEGEAHLGGDRWLWPGEAVSNETTGEIAIPSVLGGCPVTCVDMMAFRNCGGLTKVTIPNSVTNIEQYAFEGCYGITNITIPSSVVHIGEGVFSECYNLAAVEVDSENNFYKSVDGLLLTKDGSRLLCGVNGNVVIPQCVTYICEDAFRGFSGLSQVLFHDEITYIGPYAFFGCSGLASISIPNCVTNIAQCCFSECSGLIDVSIPEGVTSFGAHAFSHCVKLEDITIPNGVDYIGEWAFYGCTNLSHIVIPGGVKLLKVGLFYECANLSSIVFTGDAPSMPGYEDERKYVFSGVAEDCCVYALRNSNGWGVSIPGTWNGMTIDWYDPQQPSITDVTAKQRYPWNGLVDITCKVTGIDGADKWKFSVEAVVPDTGNTRKISQFWVVKNGVNSTDKKVQANGAYKLLWDAQAELGAVLYSNMVMRVKIVDHDKVQLWEGGPYWATTNIGAENPEDYGYYFWWGDTVGYKRENNKWVATDGSSSNFSFSSGNAPTYNKSIATLKSEGWITEDSVLVPAHDAAHVHWGGNWRMPTKQELSDLNSKCDWTWATQNGVKGYVVKGKGTYASASIFLPCAGLGLGASLDSAGLIGGYWSSVPDSRSSSDAWGLDFRSGGHDTYDDGSRYDGQSVRPLQGFTN